MPRLIDQITHALQANHYQCQPKKEGNGTWCRKIKADTHAVDEEFWWNAQELRLISDHRPPKRINLRNHLMIDAQGMSNVKTILDKRQRFTAIAYNAILYGNLTVCVDIQPRDDLQKLDYMQIYTCQHMSE